jgi:glutaredoxin
MPGLWRRLRAIFALRRRADTRVKVYTRANCPLCDKAAAFLESERQRLGFTLEWVDIASDPELTARHGEWIPVVEVNGVIRFRGQINSVLWRRLMRNG